MLLSFNNIQPQIGDNCFIAPDATLIGDVTLGDQVSVFFNVVMRGDILPIRVGSRTNIQEHSLLHTSHNRTPTIVGESVTIGHRAIIHGCTVEDQCLIGMGATVLDGAVIGEQSLVGANSLVLENTIVPPRSLVVGSPAKVIRTLDDEALAGLSESADTYVNTGQEFLKLLS